MKTNNPQRNLSVRRLRNEKRAILATVISEEVRLCFRRVSVSSAELSPEFRLILLGLTPESITEATPKKHPRRGENASYAGQLLINAVTGEVELSRKAKGLVRCPHDKSGTTSELSVIRPESAHQLNFLT